MSKPLETTRAKTPRAAAAKEAARPPWVVRHAWIVAPLVMVAAGLGIALVLARPAWLTGAVLTGLVGAGFLWLAVSVFWPARADRSCPTCGDEGLERIDASTTRGVRCRLCGHEDPDASGWFLAEEEGPLEEIVLAQREDRQDEARGGARDGARDGAREGAREGLGA